MRTASTLLLALAATTSAMTLGVSSASASTAVEVSSEPGGTHCGNVSVVNHESSGGCSIDATGTATLRAHTGTSEIVISVCSNTFEGNINEEGAGYITHQELAGASCGITPCDETEGGSNPHADLTWPVKTTELFPLHEALGVLFCVRPIPQGAGSQPSCGVVIDVSEPFNHDYRFTANGVPCLEAPNTELTGSWTLDTRTIEMHHL